MEFVNWMKSKLGVKEMCQCEHTHVGVKACSKSRHLFLFEVAEKRVAGEVEQGRDQPLEEALELRQLGRLLWIQRTLKNENMNKKTYKKQSKTLYNEVCK